MENDRSPSRPIFTAAFPAFIVACGTGLALFQLLPQQRLTMKLRIIEAVAIAALTILLTPLIRYALRKWALRRAVWIRILLCSLILTILIVFWFNFSFPHKEFTIPQRQIILKTETPNPAEKEYVFLSLHNGYRGVPLADFLKVGDWQRDGEKLKLTLKANESAALTFSGRTGHQISLFAERIENGGTFLIDWGDGSQEKISLTADDGNPAPVRIAHTYFDQTLFFERLDFAINLISIVVLTWFVLSGYLAHIVSRVSRRSASFRGVFILLTLAAIAMRLFNIFNLPLDWDEGTYARAAMRYADKVLALEVAEIPAIEYNHEHPALTKLIFAAPIIVDGRDAFARIGIPQRSSAALGREDHAIFTARFISAFFNLLTTQALICLIHPLAAFFFMIHSLMSEMGSTARLEAIPALFSFLSVYFARQTLKKINANEKLRDNDLDLKSWLFSALCLGVTAASKIIYCVVAFAIIPILILTLIRVPRYRALILRCAALYALVALASFFIFNPSLWYDPIGRLNDMLNFHRDYQSDHFDVHPAYQPLIWISRSVLTAKPGTNLLSPVQQDPFGVIFAADELIFLLALIGIPRLFKRAPIYILWLLAGTAFMFLWGTKWSHYACIVTIPLCISAMFGTYAAAQKIFRYNAEPGNEPY